MSDFTRWLEELGLEKFAAVFAEQEIDEDVARDLTEDDLRELGLPMGPRKRILKALSEAPARPTEPEADPAPRIVVRDPPPELQRR